MAWRSAAWRTPPRCLSIDTRNEAKGFSTACYGGVYPRLNGGSPLIRPVIEGIDLAQSQQSKTAPRRHLSRLGRSNPVEERAAEIVARFDACTAKRLRQVQERLVG